MEHYSVNDYCLEKFGKKLYKLSLDGGFTCPNRDGTAGTGGCLFCSGAGSGEFAERGTDILTQIENAKKRVAGKNKDGYIAYFQSFTNTYAPVARLRELFTQVIGRDDIDVLSIATRPDCLEDEKIALLRELNGKKPVWVELGLQTSNETTARLIRRGYRNEVYTDAVRRLKQAGIYVITHMIIGLPGEDVTDMKNTVRFMTEAGTDGVKLHLLHVLKDAPLYEMWKEGTFRTLTKEEYLSILSELLPLLPEKTAVHRLTGDGDKKTLVSPLWSADKKDVMNSIKNYEKEKMPIPDYVRRVMDTAEAAGYEAYLVGGCVRDHLLGQTPGDYDMAVSSAPEETMRCFEGFRLIETGLKHGTVTVVSDGHNLELTSFRFDGAYTDSRRPDSVEFTNDIHNDVARRDFTVNAMAYSPTRGYVDDFGGKDDLKNRIIRCVGDPRKRFSEDALRIMRALRFASALDFTIEKETAAAAEELRDNLKNISAERIFAELKKLLAGRNAEKILLRYKNILCAVLPELADLPDARYAENARNVKKPSVLSDAARFAALLTGLSDEQADRICRELRTDNRFRTSVCFFLRYREHIFRTAGEAKRLAGEKGADRLRELLAFREATGIKENEPLYTALSEISENACLSLGGLAVNGADIQALGAKGKEIGKVLSALLRGVTENEIPNEKNALLQRAEELLHGKNKDLLSVLS